MAKTNEITKHETETPAPDNRCTFTPRVDIWETAEAVHLDADLPGVDEKHVDINLEDGVLTILGRVTVEEPAGYHRTHSEYDYGNFERSFRITDAIDEEKIQASMKHGLLRLVLPKKEAVKPRRISVSVA